MLRHDLAAADIAYRDDNGRVADFHSLRGTYISLIVSGGASVKTAQTLARHSTPSLTIGIYAKASVHDLAGAVESLPDLTPSEPERERTIMQATGTDGQPIRKLFAHYLPTGEPGEGHDGADRDGNACASESANEPILMGEIPSKSEGLDGSVQGNSATDKRRGWDSNPRNGLQPFNGFQDRPNRPLWHPSEGARLTAYLVDDIFRNEDRHVDGHRQGDRIAGAGIDLQKFSLVTNSQLGEIGMITQFADVNIMQLAPQQLDRVGQEVMGERARVGWFLTRRSMLVASKMPITIGNIRSPSTSLRKMIC